MSLALTASLRRVLGWPHAAHPARSASCPHVCPRSCCFGFQFRREGGLAVWHDDLGFTVVIPEGWKQIPDAKLDASSHAKDLGDRGAVLAGYARGSSSLTPPYIVIDGWIPDIDLTQATWKHVEEAMDTITVETAQSQGLLDANGRYTGQDLSPSILDKDRRMIIMRGDLPRAAGSTKPALYLVTATFLGAENLVRIHAYLAKDRVASLRGDVDRMLNSAAFDPGIAYEPFKERPRQRAGSSGTSGFRYGRRFGLYGGFGGIGLLVWFIMRCWADS